MNQYSHKYGNRQFLESVGFPKPFKSFPQFIIDITYEIWENRAVESIRKYYAANIKMHLPNTSSQGNEEVVRSTYHMLHMFPDRRLLPCDVVWEYKGEGAYVSFHLILSNMTHLGDDSFFGTPSGKNIKVWTIAECWVKKGEVYEEWLARDFSGMLMQTGIEEKPFALKQLQNIDFAYLDKKINGHQKTSYQTLIRKDLTTYASKTAHQYLQSIEELWSNQAVNVLEDLYDLGCQINIPGGNTVYGIENLKRFYFRYFGSFTKISFSFKNIAITEEKNAPLRIASRFEVVANFTNCGAFSISEEMISEGKKARLQQMDEATSKAQNIYFFGFFHAEFYGYKVKRETLVIDETALQSQLLASLCV